MEKILHSTDWLAVNEAYDCNPNWILFLVEYALGAEDQWGLIKSISIH